MKWTITTFFLNALTVYYWFAYLHRSKMTIFSLFFHFFFTFFSLFIYFFMYVYIERFVFVFYYHFCLYCTWRTCLIRKIRFTKATINKKKVSFCKYKKIFFLFKTVCFSYLRIESRIFRDLCTQTSKLPVSMNA